MFSEHAIRMIRSGKWKSPTQLARELYAIFSSARLPLSHDGPITLTGRTGESPLTVRQFGDGPLINFVGTNGESVGTITASSGQVLTFAGTATSSSDDDEDEDSGGGTTIPCTVVSGSGDSYTVTIFPDGRSAAGTNVSANFPADSDDDIPAGTKWFVILRGDGTYELDMPVYL